MLVYKKVFDLITKTWVTLPFETDPSMVETNKPGKEKLKAIGHYKGMKTKSFSELTEEEQKLFTEGREGSEEGPEDDS